MWRAPLLLLLSINTLTGHLAAEEVRIPIGQQTGAQPLSVPLNGESRQRVLKHFGPPDKEYPRVGRPPISRWDYSQFSVYFERDRVLSSVIHHAPAASLTPSTAAEGAQP